MFKLQDEKNPEIKIYDIVKYNYHITIHLTNNLVKIQFAEQFIFITIPRLWDGQKRYILTNETTGKTTVLHQVVFTNHLVMYNHFIEALQHIIHKFSANHLLYMLKTVLSLRNYPILAHKFHHIWENPLFETKYKLLKYKINQNRTIEKLKKYEAASAFQQAKIKLLETEFKQLSNDKPCIDVEG
jgi:hypothetical protein